MQRLASDPVSVFERYGTTVTDVVNRIESTFHASTEQERIDGSIWYGLALESAQAIASAHDVPVDRAVGVIAALSPRMPWSRNVAEAERLISTGTAKALGANVRKALAVLDSGIDVLTAPKTASFTANILGNVNAVTVDAWAARIALGEWNTDRAIKLTGMYGAIAHAYRVAGKRVGVSPAVIQAITWVHIRNNPNTVKVGMK